MVVFAFLYTFPDLCVIIQSFKFTASAAFEEVYVVTECFRIGRMCPRRLLLAFSSKLSLTS